ncbi:glycosyltransferase family 8 protein [Labrys portucalensis]|uniref:Glycosyltransferase family 8 protein n=1 Tax=Labrys neptuniae TaxID=376174 RepID=A0ABV6ZQF8_9HYPH
MATEPIVVLYCIDDAYIRQAAISLASLLDKTPARRIEVTIAAFDRDYALSKAVFTRVLQAHRHCTLRFVDLDDRLFQGLPVTRSFSRSIYARLILQRFIEPHHRRLLYLDADTIVCDDISPLWQTDLGDATLGAVPDHFRLDPARIGFAGDEPYFNSGMLLIDVQRWRERDCERRVFDILAQSGEKLAWMDQDALNIALRGEVLFLGQRWNWQPRCADVPAAFLDLEEAVYRRWRAAPGIVHYTTSFKPWNAGYRVHYSALFFGAAEASGIPSRLLPARAPARGIGQRLLALKTGLRWRIPRAFRSMRLLLKPRAAAAMYRAGPAD